MTEQQKGSGTAVIVAAVLVSLIAVGGLTAVAAYWLQGQVAKLGEGHDPGPAPNLASPAPQMGAAPPPPPPQPELVGKSAPEIEGEDVDGKAFKLSDYRGKVVLLDFWGHW